MKRFVQGEDRAQVILLPACLDDYVTGSNPVRVVDDFVDELNLGKSGFEGIHPADTGRPKYYAVVLPKISANQYCRSENVSSDQTNCMHLASQI